MKAHSRSARLAARTVEPAPADPVASVARLANAAAHEINNPLTVIIGHLELLARDVETHSFAYARLRAALEAAERIREMVHCMRHVARLEVVASGPNLPEMLDLRKSSASAPARRPSPVADPVLSAATASRSF
jgi:signal transduction histidine kinase